MQGAANSHRRFWGDALHLTNPTNMQPFKPIEKRALGMGDRVARQGKAQLQVSMHARDFRIQAAPVWTKSNREHTLVGTELSSVLVEAVSALVAHTRCSSRRRRLHNAARVLRAPMTTKGAPSGCDGPGQSV